VVGNEVWVTGEWPQKCPRASETEPGLILKVREESREVKGNVRALGVYNVNRYPSS
jgi:hypothetical protein